MSEQADQTLHDPLAQLERTLIQEFLRDRGYDLSSVAALPKDQAVALLKEASVYASGKLTEVETRAHYIDELHSAGSVQTTSTFDARRTVR